MLVSSFTRKNLMIQAILAASAIFHYVLTPAIDIYEEPSFDSGMVCETHFSEEARVLDEVDEWMYIETEFHQKGWIPKTAIIESKKKYPSPNKISIRVKQPYAYLYAEVNDLYPLLTLPFESKLEVVTFSTYENPWIKVVLPDGKNAYIHQDQISFDHRALTPHEMCMLSLEFQDFPLYSEELPFEYKGALFTRMLYWQMGINLPLGIQEQLNWEGFSFISPNQMSEGDLVFFGQQGFENVGLYLGNNEFIHASPWEETSCVKIEKLQDSQWHYLEARTLHPQNLIIETADEEILLENNVQVTDEEESDGDFLEETSMPYAEESLPSTPISDNERNNEASGVEEEENLCRFYFINKEKMPLVISPNKKTISFPEFQKWVEENRVEIKTLLSEHGALLLRDFPVKEAHEFASIVTASLGKPIDYKGGEGSRTKVSEGIYTSTEAPQQFKIHLHNELSCTDSPVSYLCFYCEVAPSPGSGQTILGRTETITQAFKQLPEVWNCFEGKTMKYISRHPPQGHIFNQINITHKTWQDAFETDDKDEVERICQEKGFEFKWHDDWIEVIRRAPAIRDPDQFFDFPYWYNQVHLYHFNPRLCGGWPNYILANALYAQKYTKQYDIEFEDGTLIPREIIYQIYDTLEENTIYFNWQEQDVLMLDNFKALHGRAPYEGPRRILAALVK